MISAGAKTLLEVRGLTATVSGKQILQGIDLVVRAGEVHAIMGPNGSGKSTFAKVLAGHPSYVVTGGEVLYQGKGLLELAPEQRAREGVFLAFQYPIEVPGVANSQFLRLAYNTVMVQRGRDELDPLEFDDFVREKLKLVGMDPAFLDRSVNEGFSGGEKKRNEILQMAILEPRLAILDETDSGLDIDALRVVAGGVNQLANKDNAIVLVTHYQRLLDYIEPDYVHVMERGQIIKTGAKDLAVELETRGYDWVRAEYEARQAAYMESASRDYLESLLAGAQRAPGADAERFSGLRAQALERANALTLPTTRDEEWRVTDLSLLKKISFQPAVDAGVVSAAEMAGFAVDEAAVRLTFVDGVFAPALSAQMNLPAGVHVGSLRDAPAEHATLVEQHLARHARFEDSAFTALNTSFLRDGALIVIGKDCEAAAPLHLLFIATRRAAPQAIYPRCLIVAAPGSRATLIEDYVAAGEGVYLTNAVTEVVLGEGARVAHVKLQRESAAAFHIARCAVSQARDSSYASATVTFGARLSRYNLDVTQAGEGTQTTLDGLALIAGRQLADTHTFMDHAVPHGSSRQLHKCVVAGGAHAVFNGKVLVRKGAQLTDSAQSSRNLLLSPKARVDTKPQLEIFADDVKCAHGATVGQLEEDEVFYLRSRGLSERAARNLLTYAFAAEVIERVPVASLKRELRRTVLQQTGNEDQI